VKWSFSIQNIKFPFWPINTNGDALAIGKPHLKTLTHKAFFTSIDRVKNQSKVETLIEG